MGRSREALRDDTLVKLVKVQTDENLADMNSKLLSALRFVYLRDKIMSKEPTPAMGSMKTATSHAMQSLVEASS